MGVGLGRETIRVEGCRSASQIGRPCGQFFATLLRILSSNSLDRAISRVQGVYVDPSFDMCNPSARPLSFFAG